MNGVGLTASPSDVYTQRDPNQHDHRGGNRTGEQHAHAGPEVLNDASKYRTAYRTTTEEHQQVHAHDPATYGIVGSQLHGGVRRWEQQQHGRANRGQNDAETPLARHSCRQHLQRGQGEADPDQAMRRGPCPPRADQRTSERPKRQDGGEQPVPAGSGVEDGFGVGGKRDRQVVCEHAQRTDQHDRP